MAEFVGATGRRYRSGNVGFDVWYAVDLSSILPKLEAVIDQTLYATVEDAQARAKQLAPVRRVVKGDRGGKTRRLAPQERSAEQKVRVQLGLRSGKVINTAAEDRRIRSMPSNPYLRAPGRRPRRTEPVEIRVAGRGFAAPANVELNRHGRKELERAVAIKGPTVYGQGSDKAVARNRARLRQTNSAAYYRPIGRAETSQGLRGGGIYTLGGRLRGEIFFEKDSKAQTGRVKYWLISPTYYSRFVEFGTRHNKAQPYMRPALAIARRRLGDTMRSNLRKLNWKPKRVYKKR